MLLLINVCCGAIELTWGSKQAVLFCPGSQILEGCSAVYLIARVKSGEDEGSPRRTEADGKCTEVGASAMSLSLPSH